MCRFEWRPAGFQDFTCSPQLSLALPTPIAGRLTVAVLSASDLENVDSRGFLKGTVKKLFGSNISDPFCVVTVPVAPGEPSAPLTQKFTTKVVTGSARACSYYHGTQVSRYTPQAHERSALFSRLIVCSFGYTPL